MDDAQVDESCACAVTTQLDAPSAGEAPIACTLDPADLPDRLRDWRSVAEQARSRHTAADGTVRLDLDPAADVEGLARLVAAEQSCCAFFSFAITVDARGVGLEVRAPDQGAHLVAALLGDPT